MTKPNALLKSFGFWLLFLLVMFLTGSFIVPVFPDSWERFVYGIVGTLGAFLITWIFLKQEKKGFQELGLVWEKMTAVRFAYGMFIGFFLFALILLPVLAFSDLTIAWNKTSITITEFLFYFSIIPLAWMEEIAFRTFPFVRLNRAFGFILTQGIVAIAFALYHIVNGWDIVTAFIGPACWSLVFTLATYRTGGIAMATGIHVALNIAQPIVGMKTGTYHSLWLLSLAGGESEAAAAQANLIGSIVQVIIFIASIILSIYYYQREKLLKI